MTARALPSLDEPKRAFKGVWIPSEIWDNKTLSWFGKCLLAEIESLDDGKGCWASNEFLAKRMDSTPESIRVLIYKLTKEEWLTELDPPKDGPKRLLKVIKGYGKNVMAITKTVTAITDFCNSHYGIQMPKKEIYSMIGGDLLGFPVPEIPIEIPEEKVPPIPPKGGSPKKKEHMNGEYDGARKLIEEFGKAFSEYEVIGESKIRAELKAGKALLAVRTVEEIIALAKQNSQSTFDGFKGHSATLVNLLEHWSEIKARLKPVKSLPVLAYRTREL